MHPNRRRLATRNARLRPTRLAALFAFALASLAARRGSAQSERAHAAPVTLGDPRTLSVQPTLAAQLRFGGAWAPSVAGSSAAPALELRRVRVGLRFNGLDGRISGQLVVNAAPVALELLDAFVEARALSNLRVRVGQSKVPFTAYRAQSFTELSFVDWAIVSRAFGSERQLGVELHNRGSRDAVEYGVGLYHGATMRAAHGAGVAADFGERVTNLSDLRAYTPPEAPHPEVVARLAWHHGRRAAWAFASPSDAHQPAFGVDVGLSASADAAPRAAREFAYAVAPEVALRLGPASLAATGYLGANARTQTEGLALMGGVLVEASVVVRQRAVIALRFARVERSDALRADAHARADELVAEAPEATRSSVARQYADAGRVVAEQELTLGTAVALWGSRLVWQSDAGWVATYRDDGARHEVRARTQLQLLF